MLNQTDVVLLSKINEWLANKTDKNFDVENLKQIGVCEANANLRKCCDIGLFYFDVEHNTYAPSPLFFWSTSKKTHYFFDQQGISGSQWKSFLWFFKEQMSFSFSSQSDASLQVCFRRYVMEQVGLKESIIKNHLLPLTWTPNKPTLLKLHSKLPDIRFWQEAIDVFIMSTREQKKLLIDRDRAFYAYALTRLQYYNQRKQDQFQQLKSTVLR